MDGVYAVGDPCGRVPPQVVTATADGAIAAVAAEKYINEENFREVLDKAKPVAIMFWSPFHEGSLAAVPAVEEFAAANSAKLDLVKIDTYRNQRIARRYGVQDMPALLLIKGGEVLGRVSGQISPKTLAELITLL